VYEHQSQLPLSASDFVGRLLRHVMGVLVLLGLSLVVGMAGYMYFEQLSPASAFLNSAMLLGGMGPVDPPLSTGGKLFAGGFALYAGLVFIFSAALVVTPVAHRVLHKFHWDGRL